MSVFIPDYTLGQLGGARLIQKILTLAQAIEFSCVKLTIPVYIILPDIQITILKLPEFLLEILHQEYHDRQGISLCHAVMWWKHLRMESYPTSFHFLGSEVCYSTTLPKSWESSCLALPSHSDRTSDQILFFPQSSL